MGKQNQTKTQNKPVEVPLREGYQPTGTKVDLSKVKPPRQGTAAQKPNKTEKEPK